MSDEEEVKVRNIGLLCPLETRDDLFVAIDHVWGGGSHEEADSVGLTIRDGDTTLSVALDPGEALIIAERLQRAAGLVLESMEDAPDFDRDFRRLTGREGEE